MSSNILAIIGRLHLLEKKANALDDYLAAARKSYEFANSTLPVDNVWNKSMAGAGIGALSGAAKGLYDQYTEDDPKKKKGLGDILNNAVVGGGIGAGAGAIYGAGNSLDQIYQGQLGRKLSLLEKVRLLTDQQQTNGLLKIQMGQKLQEARDKAGWSGEAAAAVRELFRG